MQPVLNEPNHMFLVLLTADKSKHIMMENELAPKNISSVVTTDLMSKAETSRLKLFIGRGMSRRLEMKPLIRHGKELGRSRRLYQAACRTRSLT